MESVYHPILFYALTILPAIALCPTLSYISARKPDFVKPTLLAHLSIPAIAAIGMIYGSQNETLINDFWNRLFLFNPSVLSLAMILFLMPSSLLLATYLSLFCGHSKDQFRINNDIGVYKGWGLLGFVLPLLLAPTLEELGWRGYGIDSLSAYCSPFVVSVLFGLLWGAWHLPLFFVRGYYHNELIKIGTPYVINFFASIFVIAFLMNWVFYQTDRSIPAMMLFHAMLNLFSMMFRTSPFTKCLLTVVLTIFTVGLVVCNIPFFFRCPS